MKKKKRLFTTCCRTATDCWCDQKPRKVHQWCPLFLEKSDAVAIVTGQYIPSSVLGEVGKRKLPSKAKVKFSLKEKLIEELIQRELLVQDAYKAIG